MRDNKDRRRSEEDAELEREIREGRKFTLAEAIGRLAGPGASGLPVWSLENSHGLGGCVFRNGARPESMP